VNGVLSISDLNIRGGFVHGFSTLVLGDMRRGEDGHLTPARRGFAEAMGVDAGSLSLVGAVHGVDVARVDEPRGVVAGVDGLLTDRPGLPLLATFADCRPVVLFDPTRHALALCHVGWRGAAAGMAGQGVAALNREYGSRPEDLLAGIGPGICAACYEVGPEVAGRFDDGALSPGGDGRFLLDVALVNRLQLIDAGVRPDRIFTHPACTFEAPELPSHRGRPDGSRFACIAMLS
jgi:YfiH family protein